MKHLRKSEEMQMDNLILQVSNYLYARVINEASVIPKWDSLLWFTYLLNISIYKVY